MMGLDHNSGHGGINHATKLTEVRSKPTYSE